MFRGLSLVLLGLLAALALAACDGSSLTWKGVYCHPNGCAQDEQTFSGILGEGEEDCPATWLVKTSSIKVGDFSVPIMTTYNLKGEDYCTIHRPAPPPAASP